MRVEIRIPQQGYTTEFVVLTEWKKKVGDSVVKGDVVLQMESDKVSLEVEAQSCGIISEILREEGSEVNIGEVVGIIDTD